MLWEGRRNSAREPTAALGPKRRRIGPTQSVVNRIVEERIRAGKGPVGFINPVLYKNPDAMNDITEGGNGICYAVKDGFDCAPGWDPVTGLGTANYPKLLDVFMALP